MSFNGKFLELQKWAEMYNHVDYVIDYRNRLRLYNPNRNRNH
jgi:hypothetical protein